MRPGHDESPLNPIPPVIWLLLLPVVAMELVLSAGGTGYVGGPEAAGWRLEALQKFSFAPGIFKVLLENRIFPPEQMMRFVTYPFVHGDITHALFVSVFLLALGKMVGEVFRAWAVLVVFFAAAIAGALAYSLVPYDVQPLFGGYPAVYGLIGAFSYILWARLGAVNANRYRAFTLIGFLLAFQLVFGLLFGAGGWSWVAEIVGFVAGFLLSFIVSPGGWQRMVRRLRQR
ncbi:rhomboid family intramembrane serine protease [Frigidibacter sp.]|uniref:rhomboid family intramembrane serine protease n=1 Tax=Frigidibacter sp. TaxID=2586418 RepID=UPI00273420D3|nr:rhomboid family intramembrane serine protease [Frigidibacter sp.]MDP3339039.1 rhomboid family intramembrane serine protease [Frigidibacter sp.]